jgi:hypothetical protein
VDDIVVIALGQPFGDPAARDVWDACGSRLARALEDGESEPLFAALEEVARSSALTGVRAVGELIDGFADGCLAVREVVDSYAGPHREEVLERLAFVEHEGPARLAAGYAAGLEETIGRLRHQTEERSPRDRASGTVRAIETLELLAVELDRCRRMALSLGVLGVGLAREPQPGACARTDGAALLSAVGGALRGSVRRYDGVGRTTDGDFLVVLPDVSRRALAAVAERLQRDVVGELGPDDACVIAVEHYDVVDVTAAEVMAAVEHGVATARIGGGPITLS